MAGEGVTILSGGGVALSSPPANLTANADTLLAFVTPVQHIRVQNNSATPKWINFDTTASNGVLVQVAAGQLFAEDRQVDVLHVWSSTADAVNGASGIAVWGA